MKHLYPDRLASISTIVEDFRKLGYICNEEIATCVYIAYHLQKPVIVEGPAGVGKTELAKTTAALLDVPLIRLQCYEGLDESKALYEWKYSKQLLYTQLLKDKLHQVLGEAEGLEESMRKLHDYEDLFFSEHFLAPRPLYRALKEPGGAVLLIDEVDKSDPEFEAFLLEILSDFQVSVPELGTLTSTVKPVVFLTSNNARELSDALKRRCLHLHISYPDPGLERAILNVRAPGLSRELQNQMVLFVQQLRELDLKKVPSISETVDWARTLLLLQADRLDRKLVRRTLNVLLKFEEDLETADSQLTPLLKQAQSGMGVANLWNP